MPSADGTRTKRILFLATEYYFFNALKKEIVSGPRQQNFDLYVAARCDDAGPGEMRDGVKVIPLLWRRSPSLLTSLFHFPRDVFRVRRVLKDTQPDVLHNLALKPAVCGSLAALGLDVKVMSSLTGVGFLFVAKSAAARLIQAACMCVLRLSARFNRAIIVTLNADDAALVRGRMGAYTRRVAVVRGSGFDPDRFHLQPAPPQATFRFLLVSRLLYMKGIQVALDAFGILRQRGAQAELVVCGAPDPENPSSIPEDVIRRWSALPGVSFRGQVPDVRAELALCHAVVHPALGGEGVPRAIVEAASSGRPVIASDINGNRDVIVSGETGLLVPPGDPVALADAMQRAMEHPDERARWVAAARAKVLDEFTSEKVAQSYTKIYQELMASS